MRTRMLRTARFVLGRNYDSVRGVVLGERSMMTNTQRAKQLIDRGLIDAEFYAGAAGIDSAPELDVALHFVTVGSKKGLAAHPLIEPDYLPNEVRAALEIGETAALVSYLSSRESSNHAWSPVFDPREIPGGDGISALRALRGDSTLPVPTDFVGDAPIWAQTRQQAVEHARRTQAQRSFRAATTSPEWDAAIESAWVASVADATLPEGEPSVSIVMPVWNRSELVAEAIDSVIAQSFPHWELLVVDDGSTDDTVEVVQRFADTDARIRVIAKEHAGVCAARNAGLESAQGEYIAFLDSDNTWTPTFLEYSLRGIAYNPGSFVYAALEMIDTSGIAKFRGMQVDARDLLVSNSIDMNCVVVPTAAVRDIGGFDNSLRRWVDYDLVLRLAAKHPPVYLPFIGCIYRNHENLKRITTQESAHWQYAVLEKALVDWTGDQAALESRVQGRVSIVMPTYQDHRLTVRAVESVLRTTADHDVEIILVDNGSRHAVGRVLDTRFGALDNVTYIRLVRNYFFGIASNVGYSQSTGEHVLFLNNDVEVRGDWLAPLVARLSTGVTAVQPVLTLPNGVVQTAGTVFPVAHGLPSHFLEGHPVHDAKRHDGNGLVALSASAMLVRASDFNALRGFDPMFVNGLEDVDFCLRAQKAVGATFAVESKSVVVHEVAKSPGRYDRVRENARVFLNRWGSAIAEDARASYESIGFRVPHTAPDPSRDLGRAKPVVVRDAAFESPRGEERTSSLRWAIKIGADNSRGGDLWGDVPFADDLAASLRALGQDAVVDRYGAFDRPTSYLDDVVLAIRGRHPVKPQPGRTNILWVISRPDMVTTDELVGYDIIYAASPIWAAWMQEQSGREIRVLLQATNQRRFTDAGPTDPDGDSVVFVGGPRAPIGRQIVADALAAGVPFSVWGPNWARYVPEERVRGHYVGPSAVPGVYRSADIILNDHLPEMAEWGFVSNRIFDVVASGTPVISDHISGLELFDGAATTYADATELKRLVEDRSWVPSPQKLSEIAAYVRSEHSFDARAQTLLDAALILESSR